MSISSPFRTNNNMNNQLPSSSSSAAASSAKPPPSTTLSSLLAQANSLNHVDRDSELPQIRFGIDEIERMSESVAGRGKKRAENGEGQALLSNLGINTTHLSHTISQLPAVEQGPRTRRKRHGVSAMNRIGLAGSNQSYMEGDVASWSRNWHETVILSGIELQRQKTVKAFNQQFQQRILQNWELDKARILQNVLGVTDDELARLSASSSTGPLSTSALGKSALGSSTRRFPMAQSVSGKSVEREGGLVMHTKMLKYEKVVNTLNQKRLRKESFELCQALEETVKGDSKYPPLPSAYQILAHLVQEPASRDSSRASSSTETISVSERQYAPAYLGEPRSHQATALRGKFITGGKRFLEKDFETHIQETITKHPKEAALGGRPGIRNKIRAFVDVTLRSKEAQENFKPESVNGIYVWAQAYFLVRSGHADEALNLIADHQEALNKDDWSFPGCFKSYLQSPDRRLAKTQRDQLYNDFNGHVRTNVNVDQFKYALYKLVGRFELARKSMKVASTTEDWIWLQLSLVRESREIDPPQEQYDLNDLGKLISKYGNDKFDSNGTRPFAWFNLLLFSGQFEKAIAYLYSKPQLRTDAVHFAVAAAYYGVLRVPPRSDDGDLLTIEDLPDREVCYLNFSRLIKHYIAPFFKLEPQSALQYSYLIALGSDAPDGSGEKQKKFAVELVRDIVLASRSWSKLLGSVRADGTKQPGAIERDLQLLKLSDEGDYLRQVVLSAADQSALDASLPDSIELYHLAGSYDKVIEAVNRALGHSLGQTSPQPIQTDQSLGLSGAFGGANDVYGLAQKVYEVYNRDNSRRSKVDQKAWETLGVLLLLKKALKEYEADRPDLALETLKSTNLLPLDNDPSTIPHRAENFKALLDQPTIQNLDIIILTTMKSLHTLSQNLKNSPYGDQGRMELLEKYRNQAQSLIRFAGALRLRLGADVYRQLSSLSAFF